jgi:arsenical-resistance protein 2
MVATSRGRGNRAAAWFGDYLKQQNDSDIQSLALLEGILGWATAGSEYTQHLDEYVPEAWDPADAANHTQH